MNKKDLIAILREAAAILNGDQEMRLPIIDELEGFALMLSDQSKLSEQEQFDAWYRDPNRRGSTFGYQDTPEGIHAAFIDLAREGWSERAARANIAPLGSNHELPNQSEEALNLLATILNGEVGRQVLWKLSEGQSTETEEGKAWLAAKQLVGK